MRSAVTSSAELAASAIRVAASFRRGGVGEHLPRELVRLFDGRVRREHRREDGRRFDSVPLARQETNGAEVDRKPRLVARALFADRAIRFHAAGEVARVELQAAYRLERAPPRALRTGQPLVDDDGRVPRAVLLLGPRPVQERARRAGLVLGAPPKEPAALFVPGLRVGDAFGEGLVVPHHFFIGEILHQLPVHGGRGGRRPRGVGRENAGLRPGERACLPA